jgi:Cu-Zn family superoxide dismutase
MSRFAFRLIAAAAVALPTSVMATQDAARPDGAATSLRNAQGQVVGDAVATREGGVVKVRLTVRGFTPGTHGLHLHQTGRCDAPDFASAGPHWNPAGRQHGRQNPQGPHLGDLPNLEVRPNGAGRVDFDVQVPVGTAADANPLLDADGTSIVIHAAADDERTDPAGNSGARIACGAFTPLR